MIFIDRGIPSQNCGSNIDKFWPSFDKHKRHLLCTLCRMHIVHRIVTNLYCRSINEYFIAHTEPKAVIDKYNTNLTQQFRQQTIQRRYYNSYNNSTKTVTKYFFPQWQNGYIHYHVVLSTFTRINTTAPITDHNGCYSSFNRIRNTDTKLTERNFFPVDTLFRGY